MIRLMLACLLLCAGALQAAETIRLDQAWVFWDQVLSPEDATRLESGNLEKVGMWWQTRPDVTERRGLGHAAYKFPIGSLPPGLHEIKFNVTMSAMEAWVLPRDQSSAAIPFKMGRFSADGRSEIPFTANRILSFWVDSPAQEWVLIMNVSNQSRYRGGIWNPPRLAKAPLLSTADRRQQLLNFLCTGAMLIMLLYQLMIFLRRTSDLGALALAAICFSIVIRNVGIENFFSEWITFPASDLPHDLAMKLEYIPIITAPLSSFCFLYVTYRQVKFPGIMLPASIIGSITFCCLIVMATPRTLEQLLPAIQLYCLTLVCFCLVFIAKAVRLREKGSAYTLIGMIIPLLLGIWETYLFAINQGVNITTFGAVIFVFMQSQVLAKRFALAFNQAEHLSRDLQKEVDQQTWQIRHIMRHVPQGIGTINRDLHLAPTYSDSMRSYFPRQHIEVERFDEMICRDLIVDDSSRTLFPTTMETLIGENTLSWNINSHLLIQEARTRDNRDLAFEWNPIIKDGVVDEVLVTVRDVSELKELRQKNLNLDREYECYVAFSQLDQSHALQAYQHLVRLLAETRQLSRVSRIDESWSRRVLILLHTMKGNARQVGLKSLAVALHQEEQLVIEGGAKGLSGQEQIHRLGDGMLRLDEAMAAIKAVKDRIFGAEAEVAPEVDIETILQREFSALWNNQDRSGQVKPELELKGPLHLLQTSFREAFFDVWLHLLTNSFDHGVNGKSQLTIAGSSRKPKIMLQAEPVGNRLRLVYGDNGQGLHLRTIWNKAVDLGLAQLDQQLTPRDIVAFIFAPGFSTRKDVSQSSGRGIGMDAVKTLLEAAGCRLEIEINEQAADKEYCPFRLVMDGPLNQSLDLAQ